MYLCLLPWVSVCCLSAYVFLHVCVSDNGDSQTEKERVNGSISLSVSVRLILPRFSLFPLSFQHAWAIRKLRSHVHGLGQLPITDTHPSSRTISIVMQ